VIVLLFCKATTPLSVTMTRGCASAHEVIPGARQPGARTTAMHQAQHVRGAAFGRQAWRQPCTATAPAARLYLHGGSRSSSRPQPGRHRGEVAAHAVQHRDLTTGLLESVVTLALRARLRESRGVECSISADVFSLLAGHVYGARVSGEGWRSPLNLTARTIEVRVALQRSQWAGVGHVLLLDGEDARSATTHTADMRAHAGHCWCHQHRPTGTPAAAECGAHQRARGHTEGGVRRSRLWALLGAPAHEHGSRDRRAGEARKVVACLRHLPLQS
jgi:hypothetical protein